MKRSFRDGCTEAAGLVVVLGCLAFLAAESVGSCPNHRAPFVIGNMLMGGCMP